MGLKKPGMPGVTHEFCRVVIEPRSRMKSLGGHEGTKIT